MGCDIHLHVEVKVGGQWHHYACPSIGRRYRMFHKMAGVRSLEEETDRPISPPKGLPRDPSLVTTLAALSWGSDAHTHSWLGGEEIKELGDWLWAMKPKEDLEMDVLHCYLFGNGFGTHYLSPSSYPEEVEDVRFVFWFDN